MNRRAELLSQKANELQAYLEETQQIEELTSRNKTDELVEDFDELGGYLEKRAAIISQIQQIDGLLMRTETGDAGEEERQLWLCRRLLEQISESESHFADVLGKLFDQESTKARQNVNTVRKASAYVNLGIEGTENGNEWHK